jgi:hypothetical protein
VLRERLVLAEDRFVELVIWQLPKPSRGSGHGFKYRLALVVDQVCVLRFDKTRYAFSTLEKLISDFWQAVEAWRPE